MGIHLPFNQKLSVHLNVHFVVSDLLTLQKLKEMGTNIDRKLQHCIFVLIYYIMYISIHCKCVSPHRGMLMKLNF
jgi:hypothetical protein